MFYVALFALFGIPASVAIAWIFIDVAWILVSMPPEAWNATLFGAAFAQGCAVWGIAMLVIGIVFCGAYHFLVCWGFVTEEPHHGKHKKGAKHGKVHKHAPAPPEPPLDPPMWSTWGHLKGEKQQTPGGGRGKGGGKRSHAAAHT